MMLRLPRKHWIGFYVAAAGLLLLLSLLLAGAPQRTKVAVLDVGQGDAILIQTPQGQNILIDAGADGRTAERLGEAMGFFDKTIHLFVLTHPDLDHYGGLPEVMKSYRIQRVLTAGVVPDNRLYPLALQYLKSQGARFLFASEQEDWQIGPDLVLDVLYPLQEQALLGRTPRNVNNTSVVTRLTRVTPKGRMPLMLLTGDAEWEQEREILFSGQAVHSPVLKVGHHGSRTSTGPSFLNAVRPARAVISAGRDNPFGHPHPEVLERLRGLPVWVTAQEGTKVFWF